MVKKILGFDVSSSCIGYGVVQIEDNNEIKFISVSYLKPIKKGSLLERLADTRDKIKDIIEEIKPGHIAIEDILLFVAGRSSANTITVLASFNRMIGLVALDYLKRTPQLLSVMKIRNGIKTTEETPDKVDMPELIAKHLKIKFPYKYNKKGKIDSSSLDMADGLAVALMQAFLLTGKANLKETGKKKKNTKTTKKRRRKKRSK